MNLLFPAALLLLLLGTLAHAQSRCRLVPDPGPCEAAIERWFYNPATNSCESFNHGGCDGVVPFLTEEGCRRRCEPCLKIPRAGNCTTPTTKWFYNNRKERCQSFTWSGCRGIIPFQTFRECRIARCTPSPLPRPSPIPLEARCDLKPDAGPCRKDRTGWYWDADSESCKSFRHGGCLGTVPFRWRAQCRRAKCGGERDVCNMIPKKGPCPGEFVRWYYNPDTDSCEDFKWGGCGGTVPFLTRSTCQTSRCVRNRCALEPERGPCDGAETKYFFNQETASCESFSHGGCFGLVPYETMSQCTRSRCGTNRCKLRAEGGECTRNVTRAYFNAASGRCEAFTWGGCGGRVPFETVAECDSHACEVDRCKLEPDAGFCRAFFLKWFWNKTFQRCDSFVWGGCGGTVPYDTEVECNESLCEGFNDANTDPIRGRLRR